MKTVKEDINNLERVKDVQTVQNIVTADAREFSKNKAKENKKLTDPMELKKSTPFLGATKQPTPKAVEVPKATLEESLFDNIEDGYNPDMRDILDDVNNYRHRSSCPHCNSENITFVRKNASGLNTYQCRECKRRFNIDDSDTLPRVLTPFIPNSLFDKNESLQEAWYTFTYKSGANPYIAKSEAEKRKVLRKYGKKVRQLQDKFFEVDDTNLAKDNDLFAFGEAMDDNVIDRKLFMTLVKLHPYGYSILNDGNFVKRVYATNDEDAKTQFRAFLKNRDNERNGVSESKNSIKSVRRLKESYKKKLAEAKFPWEYLNGVNSTSKQLEKALRELDTAFEHANSVISNATDDIIDVFSQDFPFDKSFDEIAFEVSNWCDSVIANLPKDSMKESMQLNEGAGAGYSIKGEGTFQSANNIKIVKVEKDKYGGATVDFTCDAKGLVGPVKFESYMYGGTIDEDIPIEAHTGNCSIAEDFESMSEDDIIDEIRGMITDNFEFDYNYGGGWLHSTYDGSISDDGEWGSLEVGPYSDVIFTDAKITDKRAIEYIDKCVQGDNIFTSYCVIDEYDNIVDGFATEEEAIQYCKDNHYVRVETRDDIELYNGDLDTPWYDDVEIVFENDEDYDDDEDFEESLKSRKTRVVIKEAKVSHKGLTCKKCKNGKFTCTANGEECKDGKCESVTAKYCKTFNTLDEAMNWAVEMADDKTIGEEFKQKCTKKFSLSEGTTKFQKDVTDTKTGDTVTITGETQADLTKKVKHFKQTHGGEQKYQDTAEQKQVGTQVKDRVEEPVVTDKDNKPIDNNEQKKVKDALKKQ